MAAFNNCIFLYLGKQGICPYMAGKKKCNKKCDKFVEIGDVTSEISKDWDIAINKLALELRAKYFPEYEEEFKDIDWEEINGNTLNFLIKFLINARNEFGGNSTIAFEGEDIDTISQIVGLDYTNKQVVFTGDPLPF